jgi:hypothetical protein
MISGDTVNDIIYIFCGIIQVTAGWSQTKEQPLKMWD